MKSLKRKSEPLLKKGKLINKCFIYLILSSLSKSSTEKFADILIEKAWTEINYCKMYAKLSDFLGKNDKLIFDGSNKNVINTNLISLNNYRATKYTSLRRSKLFLMMHLR